MIRRLAVAAALMLAAAAVGTAVQGSAASAVAYGQCPANTECGWLYYSDPGHTHLQGGHTTNCQGVVLDWGIKAGYSVYIVQGCGGTV